MWTLKYPYGLNDFDVWQPSSTRTLRSHKMQNTYILTFSETKIIDIAYMACANEKSITLSHRLEESTNAMAAPLEDKNPWLYQGLCADLGYLADRIGIDPSFTTFQLGQHSNFSIRFNDTFIACYMIPERNIWSWYFLPSTHTDTLTTFSRDQKESTIAFSTCEAEYIAASLAPQEFLWLCGILVEIAQGCSQLCPSFIFRSKKRRYSSRTAKQKLWKNWQWYLTFIHPRSSLS